MDRTRDKHQYPSIEIHVQGIDQTIGVYIWVIHSAVLKKKRRSGRGWALSLSAHFESKRSCLSSSTSSQALNAGKFCLLDLFSEEHWTHGLVKMLGSWAKACISAEWICRPCPSRFLLDDSWLTEIAESCRFDGTFIAAWRPSTTRDSLWDSQKTIIRVTLDLTLLSCSMKFGPTVVHCELKGL